MILLLFFFTISGVQKVYFYFFTIQNGTYKVYNQKCTTSFLPTFFRNSQKKKRSAENSFEFFYQPFYVEIIKTPHRDLVLLESKLS